jgi:hypothetical protein
MRLLLLAPALLIALSSNSVGNTGVFFGSGHSLKLIKSADVQMAAEDVLITPTCGFSASRQWAEFRCRFVLKSLSSKAVTIQVGFPLDRELAGPPPRPSEDIDKVLDYHFIARDAKDTYHVRYVGGDRDDKLAHIFLWDMDFSPNEEKTLHVSYILPMSFAATSTNKDALKAGFDKSVYVRPWQPRIESCFTFYFIYVTETGKSWVGPIEHATFRFMNKEFEKDLRHFPDVLGSSSIEPAPEKEPQMETSKDTDSMIDLGFVPGMKFGTFCAHITPEGWKAASEADAPPGHATSLERADGISWDFENYKPGEPLDFSYYFLNFPQTPANCDSWVRLILGKTPAKADILELREVLAAFFGVAPKTGQVRRIAEKEVWYNPKSKLNESQLSETQRAILSRLTRLAEAQNKLPMKSEPARN